MIFNPVSRNRFFLSKVRWQISILAHIGFAISFAIRSNFGVAKSRMITNFTDAWGEDHVSSVTSVNTSKISSTRILIYQSKTELYQVTMFFSNITPIYNPVSGKLRKQETFIVFTN
ncbi:unnamed protein product [Strongylus vulgaris]|uniref:Uncharacterized protein n=1 Tax=Strongylus vulgaris TaxID=40348 RepID=A0A3P7JBU0_STRVU|nr:unnamed protein product [Strongylus vulgaris]